MKKLLDSVLISLPTPMGGIFELKMSDFIYYFNKGMIRKMLYFAKFDESRLNLALSQNFQGFKSLAE
jgi:hypothetical protein